VGGGIIKKPVRRSVVECRSDVVDRRQVKLSVLPQRYRDVPRDVTRDDVTDEQEEERRREAGYDDVTEWRLWPIVGTASAAAAAGSSDSNDSADDDVCTERGRPDLVPCQSPAPWHDQELNKTSSDVTALRQLASPVYHHFVPVV